MSMQNRAPTEMIDATVGGTTPHTKTTANETGWRVPVRIRWILGVASALVVAYLVSLFARPVGSYSSLVDGWGVATFEVAIGAACIWRQDCDPMNSLFAASERVRQAVLDAGIRHKARPSDPPVATVSGDVATWAPGSTASAREVIEWADEALYVPKESGRNRIQVERSVLLGPEVVPAGR
jgi:hypothetical protein